MNPSQRNLIVEVISGPEGVELKSYVVASGTSRVFGGVHRSKLDVTAINDCTMSRRHFEIRNEGDQIKLKDCNSKNGTKINGRPVSESAIEDRSIFKAGRTRFQVMWDSRSDDSEETLNPANALQAEAWNAGKSHSDPSQRLAGDPESQGENEKINPSLSEESGSNSSLESSLVASPSSYFRKPGTDLKGVVKQAEVPEDLSEDTAHSIPDIYTVEPVVRMIMRSSKLATEFKETIRALANHFDFFAVAHLAKLGLLDRRSDLEFPLYPHLDPTGCALPVAIRKDDWLNHWHEDFAQRLIASDGLLLILCKAVHRDSEQSLLELGNGAVAGFSEKDGFVPWCWPSGVSNILETMSDAMIAKWLGPSLTGLVYPHRDQIIAYSARGNVEGFANLGFQ